MRVIIVIIAILFLTGCGAKEKPPPLLQPDSSVPQSEAAPAPVPPPASSSVQEKPAPVEENLELLQSIDGVVLDYQKPEGYAFSVERVLQDEITGDIAVITNYNKNGGRNDEAADTVDIQIFDIAGKAIAANTLPYFYVPRYLRGDEPIPVEPVFGNGLLSFPVSDEYNANCLIYDYQNEAYALAEGVTGVAPDGDYFAVLSDYNPETTHHGEEYLTYYNRTTKLCEVPVPHRMKSVWDFYKDFVLNASANTAEITKDMVSAKINLSAGTCVLDYHYTKEHLQTLLMKTADGKKEVYEAWTFPNYWDGIYWGDMVVLDTESGEISYLGETDFANFCVDSGRRLLVNECGELRCYDLDSNAQIPNYMNITVDREQYRMLGVGYDKAASCWLVARGKFVEKEDDKGNEYFHLYLDAYNYSGKLIKTVDTEQVVPAWIIIWINQANIVADSGSATIRIGIGTEEFPETNTTVRTDTEFVVSYLK